MIYRLPVVLLAALGTVSLFKGLMTLHPDILELIKAYQTVTHPLWDFTLGYLFEMWSIELPRWVKDYLTLGVIVMGAMYRGQGALFIGPGTETKKSKLERFVNAVISIPIWPLRTAARVRDLHIVWNALETDRTKLKRLHRMEREVLWQHLKGGIKVFAEFLFWALFIIFLSYALFYFKPAV